MAHQPISEEIPNWGLWGNVRHVITDIATEILYGFGEIFTVESAATVISDTSSYVDVAGTWDLGEATGFDESAGNGRFTYIGDGDVEAIIVCIASVTAAGNNDIIHLRLEKNGNAITSSDATQKLEVGDDVASMTSLGLTPMSTGDWITAAVRNETAADNITAQNAHIIAVALAL